MIDNKKFYINGEWVKPHKSNDLEVINPSNEEVCAVISIGGIEDTNKAVAASKKSFISWWNTPKEQKLKLLNNLLKIYLRRSNEMAKTISLEMGAPIDWAIEQQSKSGEDHIKNFIEIFTNFNF